MGGDLKRKRNAKLSTEGRRERNCAAQKAYRQRQTLYIRELEEKLHNVTKPENERFQHLEESNRYYQHELLEAYKKLESTRISLDAVLQSVAGAIGMKTRARSCHKCENTPTVQLEPSSDESEPNHPQIRVWHTVPEEPSTADLEPMFPYDDLNFDAVHAGLGDLGEPANEPLTTTKVFDIPDQELPNVEDLPLEQDPSSNTEYQPYLAPQRDPSADESFLSGTESHPNASLLSLHLPFDVSQMGYKNIRNLAEVSPVTFDASGHKVRNTNSPFSDHISLVEHLIGQEWCKPITGGGRGQSFPSLQNYVSFMLSTFTSVSWESMRPFWVYTKAHRPVVDVTTWRLRPDAETYTKLAPWYRPTQTQLSVPHPIVIDWVPFPFLRDRLILLHSCNPRLDEIICKIADSYVMEIDFSKLVLGVQNCTVYVRVLDLVAAISEGAEEKKAADHSLDGAPLAARYGFDTVAPLPPSMTPDDLSHSISFSASSHAQSPESLPARSAASIFSSKTLALQAFRMLGMDRSPGAMKLAPGFFECHPELYDGRSNDIIARGIALTPPQIGTANSAPVLTPIDAKTLTKYTEMARWYFDVSVAEDAGTL